MAKNRNAEEIKLIEAAMGVASGFIHLLVKLAIKVQLPAGTLYKLATPEGEAKLIAATEAFLAAIIEPVKPPAQAGAALLRLVTTVVVPAIKKFVVADHFRIDTSSSAKVKIGYLGDNFETQFLPKVEENVLAVELAIHTLTKGVLDKDIRKELGQDREETTLAHLYELLSKQPKGESGVLLTDGRVNIFYIKDANRNFWAAYAYWYAADGGWSVGAGSVGNPVEWDEGRRVFSR